jgi:hypothetical protein
MVRLSESYVQESVVIGESVSVDGTFGDAFIIELQDFVRHTGSSEDCNFLAQLLFSLEHKLEYTSVHPRINHYRWSATSVWPDSRVCFAKAANRCDMKLHPARPHTSFVPAWARLWFCSATPVEKLRLHTV